MTRAGRLLTEGHDMDRRELLDALDRVIDRLDAEIEERNANQS